MAAQPSAILASVQRLHAFMDQLGYAAVVVRSGKILPRCLFHTSTASSPRLFLGAPRSSVASGAGLEPGVPRGTGAGLTKWTSRRSIRQAVFDTVTWRKEVPR